MEKNKEQLLTCKLCLETKPLIKSHIIPNFMFKRLFGNTKKVLDINIFQKNERKVRQSGHFDKDILCATCDNVLIGKLERYANNHIYSDLAKGPTPTRQFFDADGEQLAFFRFYELDYHLTKLFFLSILWKAHLSKHPFYEAVDLGKAYSERIRKMLLSGDAGNDTELEVVLLLNIVADSRPSKSVISPRRFSIDGNTSYVFHIDEIMYHFNITEYGKQDLYTKGAVRKDGIMDIAIIGKAFGRGYFDTFMGGKILLKSNPVR